MLSVVASSLGFAPGASPVRAPSTVSRSATTMKLNDPAAPVLLAENLQETLKRSLEANPKKHIALLGSTGSIGTQTLDICREYPEYFEIFSEMVFT